MRKHIWGLDFSAHLMHPGAYTLIVQTLVTAAKVRLDDGLQCVYLVVDAI